MSVSQTARAIRYTGNGSTVTAYAIPFPFLKKEHIYLAISPDGLVDPVLQSGSAYTVTRNADGQGGTLLTAATVSSPAVLTIFRKVPIAQPSTFPTSGAFPARTNETALDRLTMICQELQSEINKLADIDDDGVVTVPGNGADLREVPNWADATARATVTPQRAGQLGVQRDSQSLWIAQSSDTGDWEQFQAPNTNRLVIGIMADAGNPGQYQDAAAELLVNWDVDAAFFGGDNTYNNTGQYDEDWSVFDTWIDAGTAFPALGNHELDAGDFQTLLDAKFPYLPGNRRYYNVVLGGGLVELFVLNSGLNSVFDLVEEDGNEVGSVQHAWFVAALAASRARWRIVMFHHPPATLSDDLLNQIAPEMNWPEFAQVDAIICGHAHLLEVLKFNNVPLINLSSVAYNDGVAGEELQGGDATDIALWSDDSKRGIGRLVVTDDLLTLEVWQIPGGYGSADLLHVRDLRDFSLATRVNGLARVWTVTVSLNFNADIAENGSADKSAAVDGLLEGDFIDVEQPGTLPGYFRPTAFAEDENAIVRITNLADIETPGVHNFRLKITRVA